MRRSRYQKWEKNGLHYVEGGGRKIFETHVDQTTFFLSLSLLPVNGYYCLLSYCLRVFFFFFNTIRGKEWNERAQKKWIEKKEKEKESKRERERERKGNEVEESERNGWKIKRTTSRISLPGAER